MRALLIALLTITACRPIHVERHRTEEYGLQLHIRCWKAHECYVEAGEQCRGHYDVIEETRHEDGLDRTWLVIRCL